MSLRARLLSAFLLLALAPTLALTLVMLEQIERAHRVLVPSPGVEQALEGALVVSKTTLGRAEATLHGLASDWARLLEEGPPGPAERASLSATLRGAGVDFAQFYRREAGRWRLVAEVHPPGVLAPAAMDLTEELDGALAGDGTLRSRRGALCAVARAGAGGVVVAGDRVPPDFFPRMEAVAEGANLYRRIAAGYSAISRAALLVWALALSLLLALAAAWLATRLSRQLTRPVAEVAAAMERVAAGDLAVRVKPAGARELKRVGARFNQMAERLADARAQLARAERDAAWRGIARRVAHEIKNALTPMSLSLYGLEKRVAAIPETERPAARQGLAALVEEVESLSRLAEQFADFARLPEPQRKPVDLAALARSSGALHQRPGFEVRLDLGPDPVWVEGDALLLGRVLNNLLLNAVEAMPRGGRIEVRLRAGPELAELEIRDRGEGIGEEVMRRVFEPYFSTKGRGSGLGLSMARDIAAQHGGGLHLESRPGQGTVARLQLPLGRRPRAGTGKGAGP